MSDINNEQTNQSINEEVMPPEDNTSDNNIVDDTQIADDNMDSPSETDIKEDEESLEEDTDELEESQDDIVDDTENYDDETSFDNTILRRIYHKINEYVFFLKNTEPKRRLKILSLFFSCVLLVILILTDFIPILPNAYNRFYVGNSYVIGETQGGMYDKLGKNVIYAGNGSIMSFGPDMSCNFRYETISGSPRLEVDGSNAIVHYQNSKEVYVVSDRKSVKNITAEDVVTGAAINDKGYYGYINDEAGYESCVNVFNPSGKSVYKWHTNNHIIDISVSDNGESMVASSYTAENSLMSGKLIFFDLGKNEPIKEVVTNSNIISEVKFISDDVAVAFGDLFTAAYTNNGVMKWRIDYSGKNLKSYDISPNGEIAFIFDRYSSELSESTIEIYNTSGRIKGKYESKDNVKYISANNDCYLLSLNKKTILLDSDGDVMKKKNTAKEFRRAVLFDNYNFGFSVSDSIAEIMSVNH